MISIFIALLFHSLVTADMGGYIWMGDMIMPNDPSELMMDAQMDTSFFTEAHLEEMRVRQSSVSVNNLNPSKII